MKELTYIGKSYPVQDAAAKATGELLYVDDMTMPRMLYAKALFSPIAHARIKRIDTTAAEALPGVVGSGYLSEHTADAVQQHHAVLYAGAGAYRDGAHF